jgi:hypothetical protein
MKHKLSNIPNYISASTLKGLRRLMFRNNVKARKQFIYQDIQYVNGKWYAFYLEDFRIENQREGLDPNAV